MAANANLGLLQNLAMADGRRPLAKVAEQTEGYSGSDLMELCSRAAMSSIQESLSPGQTRSARLLPSPHLHCLAFEAKQMSAEALRRC